MSWLQLKIPLDSSRVDELETVLLALGAVSVTFTDAEDQPLFEPPPGETPLWKNVVVTALFDEAYIGEDATHSLLQSLELAWQPNGMPAVQHSILPDQDWVRVWLDDFKPMRFGKHLWVCPSWWQASEGTTKPEWQPDADQTRYWQERNQSLLGEMQQAGNTVMLLDPGLAFGTGTHPTTSLCLQWLDSQHLKGQLLLDYGCGSGILGIAALLLGAGLVHGIDNDPQALIATADNCSKNMLDTARFPIHLPEAFQQSRDAHQIPQADGIMANILAGTLIQLASQLASCVKKDGWLLLSGILHHQADDVIARYQEWFRDFSVAQEGDWVRITATRL